MPGSSTQAEWRHLNEGITSPALIVSMKYGESDFFRYLPLNRQFFRIDLPKIVEFCQAWALRGQGRTVKFKGNIHGQDIEFEGTADELQRLLAQLFRPGAPVLYGSMYVLMGLVFGSGFAAVVQIIIYAGAIMVLFLFVIMLLGAESLPPTKTLPWQRPHPRSPGGPHQGPRGRRRGARHAHLRCRLAEPGDHDHGAALRKHRGAGG